MKKAVLNRLVIALLPVVSLLYFVGCGYLIVGGAADSAYEAATGTTDKTINPYVTLYRNDCAAADDGFSNAIAGDPKDPRAYAGRAEARLCLGNYNEAIADYTQAIQMDPKWFDYFGRGMAYKAKGQPIEALSDFDSAIALNAQVPVTYIYRGVVLSSQGNPIPAQADFSKLFLLISGHPGRLNYYAWVLATASIPAYRDGPAAVQYAARACDETSWTDALVLDTLAAAYAQDGQFANAVKWQTAAVKAAPAKSVDRDDLQKRLAMYQKNQPFRDSQALWLF